MIKVLLTTLRRTGRGSYPPTTTLVLETWGSKSHEFCLVRCHCDDLAHD